MSAVNAMSADCVKTKLKDGTTHAIYYDVNGNVVQVLDTTTEKDRKVCEIPPGNEDCPCPNKKLKPVGAQFYCVVQHC